MAITHGQGSIKYKENKCTKNKGNKNVNEEEQEKKMIMFYIHYNGSPEAKIHYCYYFMGYFFIIISCFSNCFYNKNKFKYY